VVPGIGGSKAVAALGIDANGIYKPDVALALRGVTIRVKGLLEYRRKFLFQDKFIWEWADEPKKFEWKQGDYIYIPPFTNHQHFAHKEARLIVMSNRMIKEMGFDWLDQLENAPGC